MTAGGGGGCGAPAGGVTVTAAESAAEAIIEGHITQNGSAVPVGYARLLNSDGEFAAEIPLGGDGGFRFFAAPGPWTVVVLAPGGIRAEQTVQAATGQAAHLDIAV